MLMAETRQPTKPAAKRTCEANMAVHVLAENEERSRYVWKRKTLVVNAHGGLMEMTSHLIWGSLFC